MTDQENQKKIFNGILKDVEHYYTEKITAYGATARGVDWNARESQELRFDQLLRICNHTRGISINDYGCGYGALVDYMIGKSYIFQYRGYDISSQMIDKAKELHEGQEYCQFFTNESQHKAADYTVASGIFNVKLQIKDDEWKDYVLQVLAKISEHSEKGFAFNMLTRYSDENRMRQDLYYADPLYFFDHCRNKFSKFVSILHDYPLYEFTILVRK